MHGCELVIRVIWHELSVTIYCFDFVSDDEALHPRLKSVKKEEHFLVTFDDIGLRLNY